MFDVKLYNLYHSSHYNVGEAVKYFCEGYDPETGRVSPLMLDRIKKQFKRMGGGGGAAAFDNDDDDGQGDNNADLELQVAFMFFRSTLMNLGVPMEHIVAAAQAE